MNVHSRFLAGLLDAVLTGFHKLAIFAGQSVEDLTRSHKLSRCLQILCQERGDTTRAIKFHSSATRSRQHMHGNSMGSLKIPTTDIVQASSTLRKKLQSTPRSLLDRSPSHTSSDYLHGYNLEACGGFHKAGLSPPSDTCFCQSSDKSSRTELSVSFKMSLYCHSFTQTDISTETPCSTFISPKGEPFGHKVHHAFHLRV